MVFPADVAWVAPVAKRAVLARAVRACARSTHRERLTRDARGLLGGMAVGDGGMGVGDGGGDRTGASYPTSMAAYLGSLM
jgi:hypothetical protein